MAVHRHFLVPVDETELSTATVDGAVELASALGARITFLHAQADYSASLSGESEVVRLTAPDHFAYSFEGRPQELLSKAESAARARGVPSDAVTVVGHSPHRAIVAAARERGCDLIYMASHGRRTRLGMMLGSQTLKVLTSSEIPVLVAATRDPPVPVRTLGIVRDEHRSLAAVLHAWLQLLERCRRSGSSPAPELLRAIVHYIRSFPVALHHPKEEEYLFRRLRQRTSALDGELDALKEQHERDQVLVDELTEAVERQCRGAISVDELERLVSGYAQFIWEHMGREEAVVLPAAQRHLTPADWQEIHAAFSQNRDPRFDREVDAEYRRLFSRIVNLATKAAPASDRASGSTPAPQVPRRADDRR